MIISTRISEKQNQQALLIRRSIQLTAKYTPWNSTCLVQAMTAVFWCLWYKIPYILYIGLIKSPDKKSDYQGHAWIMAGSIAITGGNCFLQYHVISSYLGPHN